MKASDNDEESEASTTNKRSDILVIYGKDALQTEDDRQELMAIGAYLSVDVFLKTVDEAMLDASDYLGIALYGLSEEDDSFYDFLREKEKKGERLFFIGNDILMNYMDATGRSGNYQRIDETVPEWEISQIDSQEAKIIIHQEKSIFLNTPYESSGIMQATMSDKKYYFLARKGNIGHVAVDDITQTRVKAFVYQEMMSFLSRDDEGEEAYTYLVIGPIYPYENQEDLLTVIDLLIREKIAFNLSIMPIYENGNYPTMQHFAEILRYAQSEGAGIILHAPLNGMTVFDEEDSLSALETSLGIYIDLGVYPMALEVDSNWLFNTWTIQVMNRSKTVFVSSDKDSQLDEIVASDNTELLDQEHYWIDGTMIGIGKWPSMVSLDTTNALTYKEAITTELENNQMRLASLTSMQQSFQVGSRSVIYENGILKIDGVSTDIDFSSAEYEEDFDYGRTVFNRFVSDLSEENQVLLWIVGIISIVFIGMVIAARWMNYKRFYWRDNDRK